MTQTDDKKEFGNWLKQCRLFLGLNQLELSAILGIANQTYSNFETGRRSPRLRDIGKMKETIIHMVTQKRAMIDSYNNKTPGMTPEKINVIVMMIKNIELIRDQKIREYGWYLRKHRESVGLDVWDVARKMKIKETTLMDYEEGKKYPKYEKGFTKRFRTVIMEEIQKQRGGKDAAKLRKPWKSV